ncbi:radical SAM protein [Helicobacter pylori]|nr:radical SAM protein [Helicobacter pylori]
MLVDSFNRVIDYIRVSVTKQCNFRCQYCMPATPLNFFDDEELLPLDNVLKFLKIAIDEGVKKIRITGGEPLLRKGLDEFIAKLHAYNKEVALVLNTNGFLLKKMAKDLKNAGLSRSCNRIRLASDGKICPCLYYQDAIDAKEAIVNKDTRNIKRLLKQSVINKPEKNMWNDKNSATPTRAFYYTGG